MCGTYRENCEDLQKEIGNGMRECLARWPVGRVFNLIRKIDGEAEKTTNSETNLEKEARR